jgi:hypothetical protein
MPKVPKQPTLPPEPSLKRPSTVIKVEAIYEPREQYPRYEELMSKIEGEDDNEDEEFILNNDNSSNDNESVISEPGVINVDTAVPFPPQVVTNFGRILGLNDSRTKVIINNLKDKYADGIEVASELIDNNSQPRKFFSFDNIYNLPKASIGYRKNTLNRGFDWIFIEHDKPDIILKEIGNGTYGTVFQSIDGTIYKETRLTLESTDILEIECNRFYREFLLEAFIQVVLHTKNPSAVGEINGVYVDYRINRASERSGRIHPRLATLDEIAEGTTTMVYSFFYKMSKIPYTLRSYANAHGRGGWSVFGGKKTLSLAQLSSIFIKLGKNLQEFREYNFKHRDLHMENLMIGASGEPILIDFGMSCLKMGDDVYSVREGECDSYDLLMLMASLYEYDQGLLESSASKAIKDSMKDTYGNVYDIARDIATKRDSGNRSNFKKTFHEFYDYRLKANNLSIPKLFIDTSEFIEYWEAKETAVCGMRGCGRRSRKTRKRKSRKLRKSRKAP